MIHDEVNAKERQINAVRQQLRELEGEKILLETALTAVTQLESLRNEIATIKAKLVTEYDRGFGHGLENQDVVLEKYAFERGVNAVLAEIESERESHHYDMEEKPYIVIGDLIHYLRTDIKFEDPNVG